MRLCVKNQRLAYAFTFRPSKEHVCFISRTTSGNQFHETAENFISLQSLSSDMIYYNYKKKINIILKILSAVSPAKRTLRTSKLFQVIKKILIHQGVLVLMDLKKNLLQIETLCHQSIKKVMNIIKKILFVHKAVSRLTHFLKKI